MKIYVKAMSTPRSKALQRASFYSDDIMEHVIKIVVFYDIRRNDVSHWIDEISNWIHDADDITLKPNNKKLKPAEIEDTVFSWMGTDISDYRAALNMFRRNNQKGKFNYEDKFEYPDFTVDYPLCQELMDVCTNVINQCVPMICDKQDHSNAEYKSALRGVFSDYL